MEIMLRIVIALAVSAFPMQFVFAEMEHRMGGMPGWEHNSPNSVVVAPGKIATLVWQFGDDPVVELACHHKGSYEAGMVVRVKVTQR